MSRSKQKKKGGKGANGKKGFERIKLHVYPVSIWVSWGYERDACLKLLSDNGIELDAEERAFYDNSDYCYCFTLLLKSCNKVLVFLHSKPNTPYDYGVLQHELFHAVTLLLNHLGLRLSDSSDEGYAYLMGYVTKKTYQLFWH